LIRELFNAEKVSSVLKNKYGNFVLQKAIQCMSADLRNEIKANLNEQLQSYSNKEQVRVMNLIELI
jgi:hypothetical protein